MYYAPSNVKVIDQSSTMSKLIGKIINCELTTRRPLSMQEILKMSDDEVYEKIMAFIKSMNGKILPDQFKISYVRHHLQVDHDVTAVINWRVDMISEKYNMCLADERIIIPFEQLRYLLSN